MKINDEGTSNAAHWYERAMKAESRLAEAEALLRVMPGYGLSAYDKERWEKARNAFLTPDSAPAATRRPCPVCQQPLDDDEILGSCMHGGPEHRRVIVPPVSAPAAMERPWQEIVKDATRYMWLRRRVDTAPARGLYPWSDAAAMDAEIDAGMAATSQPTERVK